MIKKTVRLAIMIILLAAPSTAQATSWHRNREASWYGPGFWGGRTACGQTLTEKSFWVAAFKTEYMKCNLKVKICSTSNNRCVNVRVLDRGAVHHGRRDWDMTLRVKNALRCPSTCNVDWKKHW